MINAISAADIIDACNYHVKFNVCLVTKPLGVSIVHRGDWLGSPANIKRTNKDTKIYVGRSTTLHNLLFCAHTLCMSYVTNTFLLVIEREKFQYLKTAKLKVPLGGKSELVVSCQVVINHSAVCRLSFAVSSRI